MIFFLLLASNNLHAKYLSKDDFPVTTQSYVKKIRVKKDGSYQEYIKYKLKITNEEGKKQLGIHTIPYNKALSRIKIINIIVVNGENKHQVPSKNIIDVPISNTPRVLDPFHVIKIALPSFKAGFHNRNGIYQRHKEKPLKKSLFPSLSFWYWRIQGKGPYRDHL